MLCQIDEYPCVTTDGQRLREARKRRGLTQKELADALEIDHTYLSRIERDERPMTNVMAARAAKILSIERNEILSEVDDTGETVAIVGYVGAGAEVWNFEDPGAGLDRRELDGVAWTPRLAGLIVRGDSMIGRCDDGDVLLFEQTDTIDPDSIGRVSVVHLTDGRTFVKELYEAPAPGRFTLISRHGKPISDVEVMWAARVRAYLPK